MEKVTAIWSRDPKAVGADGSQDEDCYVDAMLHLGMNNSTGWQLESRAARDTYSWTGDDGVPLPTDNGGEGGRFEGMPAELWTMFDVPRMADGLAKEYPVSVLIPTPSAGIEERAQGLDIQASTNAGGAYCEFILFTSLAALRARGEAGRALFLHVPGMKAADEDIRDSVKVATSVIQRIVDEQ